MTLTPPVALVINMEIVSITNQLTNYNMTRRRADKIQLTESLLFPPIPAAYEMEGETSRSRESTFQDNNYSLYDSTYPNVQQKQPEHHHQQQSLHFPCDMTTTKRPKLLPQVPNYQTTTTTPGYIGDYGGGAVDSTSSFSFDVYGNNKSMDLYGPESEVSEHPFPSSYDYECTGEMDAAPPAPPPPTRNRRKVLPSAPIVVAATTSSALSQYTDLEFENEPLSYNSQPPVKSEDNHHRWVVSHGNGQ